MPKQIGRIYSALSENLEPCSVSIYFDDVREIGIYRDRDEIKVGVDFHWREGLSYYWLSGVEKLEFEADFSTFIGECYEDVVLPDGRVIIQKKKIPNWEV